MANEQIKYASLSNLQTFKSNADNLYATKAELGELAESFDEALGTHQHTFDQILMHDSTSGDAFVSNASGMIIAGNLKEAFNWIDNYFVSIDESLAEAVLVDDVNDIVSTHNTSTSAHDDIRALITELATRLNALADSDDTTLDQLSEIVTYIKANKSLIDSITTSKVNVSDIANDLTTSNSSKVLSAAQGVAIKSLIDTLQAAVDGKAASTHTHAISEVTNLQSTLDSKVPATRTVNGKALSSNITLSASDVNAYTKSEIDNLELITIDDIDTICGGAIQVATLSNEVMF